MSAASPWIKTVCSESPDFPARMTCSTSSLSARPKYEATLVFFRGVALSLPVFLTMISGFAKFHEIQGFSVGAIVLFALGFGLTILCIAILAVQEMTSLYVHHRITRSLASLSQAWSSLLRIIFPSGASGVCVTRSSYSARAIDVSPCLQASARSACLRALLKRLT